MLTVKQAALQFHVSPRLVRRWIAEHRLTAQKMAGVWLVSERAVRSYAATRQKSGRPRLVNSNPNG